MAFDFRIEQLLLTPDRAGGWLATAQSVGVTDADIQACSLLLIAAGDPFLSETFFAALLNRRRVAIVRVTPQQSAYFQLWAKPTYDRLGHPFQLAELFPPDLPTHGELPARILDPETFRRPPVSDLLKRLDDVDMPLTLGATQALLDGVQVRFDSAAIPETTLRLIWDLLPDSARPHLWPHTNWTPRATMRFDAVLTSESIEPAPGVLTAQQCRDYPEGRYEFALQSAIESGNQIAVNELLTRRSSQETLRLAATMLLVTLIGAVLVRLLV